MRGNSWSNNPIVKGLERLRTRLEVLQDLYDADDLVAFLILLTNTERDISRLIALAMKEKDQKEAADEIADEIS